MLSLACPPADACHAGPQRGLRLGGWPAFAIPVSAPLSTFHGDFGHSGVKIHWQG